MQALTVARPRDLREALGIAFVHRGRARWRAGTSRFLGLAYPGESEFGGLVLDVAAIGDFREIRADRFGLRVGAFADPDELARVPQTAMLLGSSPCAPEAARFRLGTLGAQLVIAGIGATRTAPIAQTLQRHATRPLSPSEIPVAVELRTGAPVVSFGDRRIRRRDGPATFELGVYAALSLSGFHRIRTATVAYSLDGGPPIPLPGVDAILAGTMIARTTLTQAATRAAEAFDGDGERTSVLRRTIIPLALSALKDAYAGARVARG